MTQPTREEIKVMNAEQNARIEELNLIKSKIQPAMLDTEKWLVKVIDKRIKELENS